MQKSWDKLSDRLFKHYRIVSLLVFAAEETTVLVSITYPHVRMYVYM